MTELYVADNEKVTTELARARRFSDQIEAIAHVAERTHLFFSNPRYEQVEDTATDQHPR